MEHPLSAGTCPQCRMPVQWATSYQGKSVPLQPGEFPAGRVPAGFRWSFTGDRVHPLPSAHQRCRIVHFDICPEREQPDDEVMAELWDRLRLRRAAAAPAAVPRLYVVDAGAGRRRSR